MRLSKASRCYSKCKTEPPFAFTPIYQTATCGGVSINSLTCLRLCRTNGEHVHADRQKMCFILVSLLRWESRLRRCSTELLCGAAPLVLWRDNVLTNGPQIDQIRTHSSYFPLRWLAGILQFYGMDKGLCSVTARSAYWIRHPLIRKITLRLQSLSREKNKNSAIFGIFKQYLKGKRSRKIVRRETGGIMKKGRGQEETLQQGEEEER